MLTINKKASIEAAIIVFALVFVFVYSIATDRISLSKIGFAAYDIDYDCPNSWEYFDVYEQDCICCREERCLENDDCDSDYICRDTWCMNFGDCQDYCKESDEYCCPDGWPIKSWECAKCCSNEHCPFGGEKFCIEGGDESIVYKYVCEANKCKIKEDIDCSEVDSNLVCSKSSFSGALCNCREGYEYRGPPRWCVQV